MSQKTPYDALRMAFDVLNEKLGAFTRSPIDIGLTTSPDYAWIAESLNPTHDSTVLWYFHQQNRDYRLLNTMTIHYYTDYLLIEIESLKTQNWKLKTEIFDYFN
jgi:hypothetical protein